jgi:mannosyltransferase OCH1-like enzyme
MNKNIFLLRKYNSKINSNIEDNKNNDYNFTELQYEKLIKYKLNVFNNNSKNVALLLESRITKNTEFILRQFSRFLPEDFAMWIYVTENVHNDYLELAKKINNNIKIILLPIQYSLTSIKDYNDIMLDITFWKLLIQFERVLIFQLDTMIYRNGIEEFYQYDYVGAPWDEKNKISSNVGNGGLSLRNIKAMIYCLENKDKVIISDYPEKKEKYEIFQRDPEDTFFSYAMNQFNYNIANIETASLFAIEAYKFNKECLGSHKLYIYNLSLYNELLNKSIYEYNIPLKIYQTWHTKDLIPNLKECVKSIKDNNPEFEHNLFDDDECREFIKNNYNQEILWAYDKLYPGAYKADLWRYCILYKTGGIYIDIKYKCINNFKFITIIDKEYYVLDRKEGYYNEQKSIYNGLIICNKNNPLLLNLINRIIENVKYNFRGVNSLHPTGPILFGILYEEYYNKKINTNDFDLIYSKDGMNINLNDTKILEIYNEYRNDIIKISKIKHYGELWNDGNIYNLLNFLKLNKYEKVYYIYQYISKNNKNYIDLCNKYNSYDDIINYNINYNQIMNNNLINNSVNYTEDLEELLNNNKLITTRIGCVESSFIFKYRFDFKLIDDPISYKEKEIDFYMKTNAGLYYNDNNLKEQVLNWWCDNTIEIIKKSTITSCFSFLNYDLYLWALLDIKKKFYNWGNIHKFILKNLSNKKLLYIGSATESIKFAYSNIHKVWKFKIGTFSMYYVKTPQTTLGMDYPDNSIIDTTNKIIDEIINKYSDFDIAILGCGAYGPPIINILNKKLGDKNMIYLGSSCYTMFGLYSQGMPIPNDEDIIKENCIEVLEKYDDKCKNIDQGKYWKL